MKSKMKILLVSVVAITAIVGYLKIRQSADLNTLLLENIEALANDEDFEDIKCIGLGSVDCPATHVKVLRVYAPYSLSY